jgi:hypothetical protein
MFFLLTSAPFSLKIPEMDAAREMRLVLFGAT